MADIVSIAKNVKNQTILLTVKTDAKAKKAFMFLYEAGYLEDDNKIWTRKPAKNKYMLGFVIFGSGRLEYNNEVIDLEEHDAFLINCRHPHKYYATNKIGWKMLYICFGGRQAGEYYKMFRESGLHKTKVPISVTFYSRLWQIITLNSKGSKHAELITSMDITRMLTEIIMLSAKKRVDDSAYPLHVNYVFNHIGRYYSEPLTLDLLTELYHVNKFHLSREFKRCSGKTIFEHLTNIRIEKAKELLRHSEKSINEISNAVGFNSSEYFIKIFRRHEHCTPLQYRNIWTN